MKKKISYETVVKYCGLPANETLEPMLVLDNAHRIHDFLLEREGYNNIQSRLILFGWASQQLELDIKEFGRRLQDGLAESPAYQSYRKSRRWADYLMMVSCLLVAAMSLMMDGLDRLLAVVFLVNAFYAWKGELTGTKHYKLWTILSFAIVLVMALIVGLYTFEIW